MADHDRLQNLKDGTPTVRRRASSIARYALLAYVCLIVYASWYPFSGWRDMGISPFAYLSFPLPRYWTWFDLLTNVVGYGPLGFLIVCAGYPRLRGVVSVIVAGLSGTLLSLVMEAVQTYLPTRVASNLDLLTNSVGCWCGALLALWLAPRLLENSRILAVRHRWLLNGASHGPIVFLLWPLAHLYPQEYLFGLGQLTPIFSRWIESGLGIPVDLSAWLRGGVQADVMSFAWSEASVSALGLTGASLTMLSQLQSAAPKLRLWLAMMLGAVCVKCLSHALLFSPLNALAWLTPGANLGLLAGALLSLMGMFASQQWQRYLAMVCITASLYCVNAAPSNPYFLATMQTWVQGKFINFEGAAQFLTLVWPLLALWSLSTPMRRRIPR